MSDQPDNSICNLCQRKVAEVFHCGTCAVSDDQTASSVEHLCQICISSHLARDHTIRNQKGQEPLICREHKMIQQEYCRSCDVILCWLCTSLHSKHEFEPLEKRASELKGRVFEMLTELEPNEKPLHVKKEQICATIEKHKSEQKELREECGVQVEKLRQRGLQVIEENSGLMSGELSQISVAVDGTVSMQQNLRDLLSGSNAHLLKKFKETEEDVNNCKKLSVEFVSVNSLDVRSYAKNLLAEEFQRFSSSICNGLQSVMTEKKELKLNADQNLGASESLKGYFICTDSYLYLYKLTYGLGKLKCAKVSIDKDEILSLGDEKSVDFRRDISCCFPVHSNENLLRVLLLSTDKKAYIFSPLEDRISLKRVTYPPYKHFLWPYTIGDWDLWEPESCYWDDETKLIKFTHKRQFTVK
ncbi:uncharacterized protein LOC142351489 [Convolutriloba macropyga]|uniref:uncharacterized protein LOC142351489 n=1 Tax=Convolutriloba macropyga TaxID=536237 RepID=UPI003F5211A9